MKIFKAPTLSGIDGEAVLREARTLIEKKLDLKDLADPEKLEKLVKRFTIMYDIENDTSATASAASILGGGSGGISADTLWALSQIRMG